MQRYYHLGEIDKEYLRGNPDNFHLDEVAPMIIDAEGRPFLADPQNYSGLPVTHISRHGLAQLVGIDSPYFWELVANDFHGVVTPIDPEGIRNGVCYLVRALLDEYGNEIPRQGPGGTDCHF
jgi:hypothetical protein